MFLYVFVCRLVTHSSKQAWTGGWRIIYCFNDFRCRTFWGDFRISTKFLFITQSIKAAPAPNFHSASITIASSRSLAKIQHQDSKAIRIRSNPNSSKNDSMILYNNSILFSKLYYSQRFLKLGRRSTIPTSLGPCCPLSASRRSGRRGTRPCWCRREGFSEKRREQFHFF